MNECVRCSGIRKLNSSTTRQQNANATAAPADIAPAATAAPAVAPANTNQVGEDSSKRNSSNMSSAHNDDNPKPDEAIKK